MWFAHHVLLMTQVAHAGGSKRQEVLAAAAAGSVEVVICTHDGMREHWQELKAVPWHVMVADEVCSNCYLLLHDLVPCHLIA